MCAIIGVSSTNPVDKSDIKILYLMAEGRGGHGCGFTNGKKTIKSAIKAYEYVHKVIPKEFPNYICDFVGHTRFATIGDKGADKNAHPFKKGNFIGVHNGSIYNHEDIAELIDSEAEVDSEVLYEMIAKFGLRKTLPLLQGILALSYYDLRDKSIYLYRNNKPLHIGYKYTVDDDGKKLHTSLFWATLPEYLKAIDCVDIRQIQEHSLVKIKNGRIVHSKQLKKIEKPIEPFTYKKNGNDYYDSNRTTNIFKSRKEKLLALGDDRITKLVEEKNNKEISKTEVETNINIPMNAFFFKSAALGVLCYWFLQDKPSTIKLYQPSTSTSEEYDLDLEEDLAMFNSMYARDDSDIVQHVNRLYTEYKEMYMIRMELEDEEEEKLPSHQ